MTNLLITFAILSTIALIWSFTLGKSGKKHTH